MILSICPYLYRRPSVFSPIRPRAMSERMKDNRRNESSLFFVEIFDGSNRSVAGRTELELNALI
jgi:hypothetical protein